MCVCVFACVFCVYLKCVFVCVSVYTKVHVTLTENVLHRIKNPWRRNMRCDWKRERECQLTYADISKTSTNMVTSLLGVLDKAQRRKRISRISTESCWFCYKHEWKYKLQCNIDFISYSACWLLYSAVEFILNNTIAAVLAWTTYWNVLSCGLVMMRILTHLFLCFFRSEMWSVAMCVPARKGPLHLQWQSCSICTTCFAWCLAAGHSSSDSCCQAWGCH